MIANSNGGIAVFNGAQSTTIGGTAVGAGNLVSGNTGDGIFVGYAGTNNNVVCRRNFVGTDLTRHGPTLTPARALISTPARNSILVRRDRVRSREPGCGQREGTEFLWVTPGRITIQSKAIWSARKPTAWWRYRTPGRASAFYSGPQLPISWAATTAARGQCALRKYGRRGLPGFPRDQQQHHPGQFDRDQSGRHLRPGECDWRGGALRRSGVEFGGRIRPRGG